MKFLGIFEKYVIRALTVMMAFVLLLATIDLAYLIVKDILNPPLMLLDVSELLDIFGLFLLVLIGIELLETMKTYLVEHLIRVEVVLMVALIAIARKIIIMDVSLFPSLTLIGIGVILIALSVGYCYIRGSHKDKRPPQG
jgi:uncharacterized membrane protein (DUF373 family)